MSNNTMPVTQQPYLLANAYPKPYNIWNMNFPTLNEISHLSLPADDRPNLDSHTVSIARVYPKTPIACLLPFFDRKNWQRVTRNGNAIGDVFSTDHVVWEARNENVVAVWFNNERGAAIEELANGTFYTDTYKGFYTGTFLVCARHLSYRDVY